MRRFPRIAVAVAVTTLGSFTTASAVPYILTAEQDFSAQAPESSFSLDFFDQGGLRDSTISSTSFGMEIDFDAGSAKFTNYSQQIGSILLPNSTGADVETGPITVSIIPGSEPGRLVDNGDGTFDFETEDIYEITFTNDLSAYGFPGQSVELPSVSTGTITVEELRGNVLEGTASMRWEDESVMLDPSTTDINNPILLPFHYRCDIYTVFQAVVVPEPASIVLLAFGATVVLRRRS
ncbi:MAG: PEP-CTERM sorting domain-containing protein [Planctomycetes bacterium]|nr:PEP-CTERM sorting domain-containing protein [Planctomycetota bacterium]